MHIVRQPRVAFVVVCCLRDDRGVRQQASHPLGLLEGNHANESIEADYPLLNEVICLSSLCLIW